mgnify:CR=1 FL=1
MNYIHKSGAVIWVNLNPEAITAIENSEGSEFEGKPLIERVVSKDEMDSKKPACSSELLPVARDGSYFSPEVCRNRGAYTVGNKGDEKKFNNYTAALSYLSSMDTARWRRRNSNGNWGIVSAIDWVVPE